jgi:hypothetical protein
MRRISSSVLAAALCGTLTGCGAKAPSSLSEAQIAIDFIAPEVAADAFLSLLDTTQLAAAALGFDGAERVTWAYVPQERAGLPLQAMNAEQRAAAFRLLGTGLSARGIDLARGIIDLEGTLRVLEEAAGSPWAARRDPELYYLAVFGGPDRHAPWGWRFEGHHLSVNVTEVGPHGQIVAPLFIGANPARVPGGPQEGLRLLAAEEDLAFELLHMLDPQQRERVIIAAQTQGDILTRNDPAVGPMAFAGLPATQMTAAQQRQLRRLLELYAFRMADAAAREQLDRIERAGFERLHFAWAGSALPGEPHYYRIHGPTVLVEYDNTQSNANHIHTVWRDLENDFGGDLLRKHYTSHPHPHRH